MQRTHTASGVNLVGVARSCGISTAEMVQTPGELDTLSSKLYSVPGPLFAAVKVSPHPTKIELAPRDGTSLRARFREALLGQDAPL
jgi:thiamine pyrophosphate-dependent acetolactate synthase large subunit-like protein